MDNFAQLAKTDKQAYFELAADKKGLSKEIIEKDFWVCWTLKQLFALPDTGQHLIFKGGTSLSKAYNVIERFSEDIDISIDKNYLGYSHDLDPETAPSSKKQQALIKKLSKACRSFVQSDLINKLKKKFSQSLNAADGVCSESLIKQQSVIETTHDNAFSNDNYLLKPPHRHLHLLLWMELYG